MFISLTENDVLHRQLYRTLREAILTGKLEPSCKLPSTRQLARDVGISRKTAIVAFDQLLAEGYIETRAGSGTYVTSSIPDPAFEMAASSSAKCIPTNASPRLSRFGQRLSSLVTLNPHASQPRFSADFRYGAVSSGDFPYRDWKKLISRTLLASRTNAAPLAYADPQGLFELRRALAEYLAQARGIVADARQIVIVNGSQQAIDITARLLLEPGDGVVIEEPGYVVARKVFEALGAVLVPAKVDTLGLDITKIVPGSSKLKLVYFTPSHQFPTGAVMPATRRLELLDWATRKNAYLLEDDYDGEFRYLGRPIAAVQSLDRHNRVIYTGTVSKTLSPTLRLGFMVVPPQLVEAFVKAKVVLDRHTATHMQSAFAEFITQGLYDQHVRKARRKNELRRNVTITTLESVFGDAIDIQGTQSGLHLLLWLKNVPSSLSDAIVDEASKFGVGIYPVTPHYVKRPKYAGFVIGYASLAPSQIAQGIESLGKALRKFLPSLNR